MLKLNMLSQGTLRSVTFIAVRSRAREESFNFVGKSPFPANRLLAIILLSLIDYIRYFKLVIFFCQLVSLVKYLYQICIELPVFAEQFQILSKIYLCRSWNCCMLWNYQLRDFCCSQYFYDLRRDFCGRNYRTLPRLYFWLFIFLLYILFLNSFHFNYDQLTIQSFLGTTNYLFISSLQNFTNRIMRILCGKQIFL